MGVLDTIFKPLSYLGRNLPGNTQAGTWNVLPAFLSTWSNLIALNNQVSKDSFALYQQQAKDYIETAKKNARMLEKKEAIELRRLEYKEKLERSNDVLRVAASGSNIGGTHLDVVIRKEKIRKMDEMALRANYTLQSMMELDNGYRQAAQTYGAIYQQARNVKWGVLNAILKGVETYTGLTMRDAKIQNSLAATNQKINIENALRNADIDYDYKGIVPTKVTPGNVVYSTIEQEVTPAIKLSGDNYNYDNNNSIINTNQDTIAYIPFKDMGNT